MSLQPFDIFAAVSWGAALKGLGVDLSLIKFFGHFIDEMTGFGVIQINMVSHVDIFFLTDL